ncbi:MULTISPECIES: hypothetical protein [Bacillus]|uniref:hypothetical protein n=1 Tax=Bacillus TaxID=1386 RepID=UPI00101BD914|nr:MULTISPECIES: hypothetical protein [Bacillus]MCA1035842.1 hypothetical protein [Bacillus infantis]MCP1157160.1 hypothetical protein [Bacillus infantis]RYI27595.1 hypothetical protein EVU96_17625 [Bacillus infantis]
MGELTRLSLLCVAINLISNILFFLIGDWGGFFTMLLTLSNLVLPMFLSFTGVLLGIGALVLKEPIIKSLLAIAANIGYVLIFFSVIKNF